MKLTFRQQTGFWLLLLFYASASLSAGGEKQMPDSQRTKGQPLILRDTDGKPVHPLTLKNYRAVVLLFLVRDCPIANAYAPEVRQIAADYALRGVTCMLVYVEPEATPKQVQQHRKEYGYAIRALLDPQQRLARRLEVTATPEAVLLGPDGKVRYQGRIDDRYLDFGKERHIPQVRDLRQSLDTLLAGGLLPLVKTKVIGCPLPVLTKRNS